MSSKLQLDIDHHNQWRRHLVNVYEVEVGTVLFAGKIVLSIPERIEGEVLTKWRCINPLLLPFPLLIR